MDTTASIELTPGMAREVQREATRRGDVLVWTVFDSPLDFQGKMVVRPFSGRMNTPLLVRGVADTLDEIRLLLPEGLYRLDRHKDDVPSIVETWI